MKITEVKTYAVHPGWRKNLLFVRLRPMPVFTAGAKPIPSTIAIAR